MLPDSTRKDRGMGLEKKQVELLQHAALSKKGRNNAEDFMSAFCYEFQNSSR